MDIREVFPEEVMLELRSAGLIEQHVKGPGVNVSYTIRGLEGRPVCLEHKELEVQY